MQKSVQLKNTKNTLKRYSPSIKSTTFLNKNNNFHHVKVALWGCQSASFGIQ